MIASDIPLSSFLLALTYFKTPKKELQNTRGESEIFLVSVDIRVEILWSLVAKRQLHMM